MDIVHTEDPADMYEEFWQPRRRARRGAPRFGFPKRFGFVILVVVTALAANAATANTAAENTDSATPADSSETTDTSAPDSAESNSSADTTDSSTTVADETEESRADASTPDSSGPGSSGTDSSSTDSSGTDSSGTDSSSTDSSTPDTSEPDATDPDTSEPDATDPDTSEPDATDPDTSTPDSSTPDSSEPPAPPVDEADRQRIEAAESAKAREVDAANARLAEVTDALAVLQQDVESQTAEVNIATRRLETAEARVSAAQEDVALLEERVVRLEEGLSEQAIRSFKGDLLDVTVIEVGRNPNQAIRMQAMLAKATESDIDFVNELAGVRENLIGRRSDAERAAAQAEESRVNSEQQLAKLETDRQAQGDLVGAADARLDHLLSERAALAKLGSDYTGSEADEAALVRQLASAPAPRPSSSASSASNTATISENDIRVAGKGIEVHVSIVEDIRQLLADAAADGVDLAGGGYRDSAGQIRARRANCGTSTFAIYEMRSSRCSPPTARPGRSMHEQGKAIDFTYKGALIRSRSGAGWNWLKANAEKYGLFNLPSEPWHWSVNGR